MERLAREKIALQQRFATLKKELSAQWDHIDFNTLIPDVMVVDSVHRTHSSAVSGWLLLIRSVLISQNSNFLNFPSGRIMKVINGIEVGESNADWLQTFLEFSTNKTFCLLWGGGGLFNLFCKSFLNSFFASLLQQ